MDFERGRKGPVPVTFDLCVLGLKSVVVSPPFFPSRTTRLTPFRFFGVSLTYFLPSGPLFSAFFDDTFLQGMVSTLFPFSRRPSASSGLPS